MFNKYYNQFIVKNNLEKYLHLLFSFYLYLLSLKNIIYYHLNFKASFSSFNQDIWIANNIFQNKKKGFFIDVGAYDGISNNNTILFEKFFKWKGYCIEPNKKSFNKLKKYRKSFLVNAAISNFLKKRVYFYEDGQLSKIYNKNNHFIKKKHKEKFSVIKNLKLSQFQKTVVDFIDIDCEGFEEEVIRSINFKKKIKCILIERPNLKTHQILKKEGMIYVKRFLFDYVYVNNLFFQKKFKEKKYDLVPKKTF